jgi:catechol 2,3-dioxygenase-like lactoylglutathione lyase family enzyme
MTVQLNHHIVWCRDQQRSAKFLTDLFGLPAATRFGPFLVVELENGVSLDYHDVDGDITPQHYAFLIGEDDFDAVSARLRERGVPTYADPAHREPGFNTHDGGRGLYFDSPEGHNLEVITRPYGSGPA